MHLNKSLSPIAFLNSNTLNSLEIPINFSISCWLMVLFLPFKTINLSNSFAILLIFVPNSSTIKKEDFLSIVNSKDFK